MGTGDLGTKCQGDDAIRLIDRYRELGGNVLDTAHIYGAWIPGQDGASEKAVGEWLRRTGVREDVFISTKGGHPPESFYAHDLDFLSFPALQKDLAESKERLGTDSIDLYYLHRDDGVTPVSELIDRLNLLPGIRYLGASNWSVDRLDAANRYAAEVGKKGLIALQNQWSLAIPNWKDAVDPSMRKISPTDEVWCSSNGIWIQPYSSTANGYFSREGAGGTFAGNAKIKSKVIRLAHEVGATPTQIALAWLLNRGSNVLPLIGTTNEAHLEEAFGALSLPLSRAAPDSLRSNDEN
jgi:aryl-alcohol dehydrogenase-like predicted oxidoreductase